MLRIDEEDVSEISQITSEILLLKIKDVIDQIKPDAIIFEDYNKGCLTSTVIKYVLDLAKNSHIFISVDPKKKNFFAYEGVDMFKPNLKELKEGFGLETIIVGTDFLNKICSDLMVKMDVKNILLTLSSKGAFYKNNRQYGLLDAFNRSISDVSGAGDTVISVATLGMVSGLSLEEATWLGNLAGGLVCEKPGVDTINTDELIEEMKKLKIIGNNY